MDKSSYCETIKPLLESMNTNKNADNLNAKRQTILNLVAQLQAENERLKADIKRFEKCFERIAKAHGLTTPLELIAMAKDNEENYAEILARHIEQALEGE